MPVINLPKRTKCRILFANPIIHHPNRKKSDTKRREIRRPNLSIKYPDIRLPKNKAKQEIAAENNEKCIENFVSAWNLTNTNSYLIKKHVGTGTKENIKLLVLKLIKKQLTS